jgi:cystathionine beta-synthase
MVLADPAGSVLADYIKSGHIGEAGSWAVEGIGEDFLPPIADLTRVHHAYTVTDAESLSTARALLKQEGILAGSSSGTLLAGALQYCREQSSPKRVVSLVCDSGGKYLSKMYNDFWMADRGFLTGKTYGDLRDVISHRFAEGDVISIGPEEPLNIAYTRMRLYDISQLPVLEGTRVTGILDESDLLLAVTSDATAFRRPVREFMTTKLQTIHPQAAIEELLPIFKAGYVAIVADDTGFYGLITQVDVVSYLRRQHQSV